MCTFVLPVSDGVQEGAGVSHSRSASVSSWDAKDDGELLRDDDGQASVCSKFRLRSGRVLDTRTRSFSHSSAARRSTFLYLRQKGRGYFLRTLQASAFLLLHLMFTAARSPGAHACDGRERERRWREKDGKSRTDEESWMSTNSRTESEKTCSRGLVQHASLRPPLIRSTSPVSSLPYQTWTVNSTQPEQRFVALNQPSLSFSLSVTPPLSHRATNVWRFCSGFISIGPLQSAEESCVIIWVLECVCVCVCD